MEYIFPAVFSPEEGGYFVEFPDVPGCFTEGADMREAFQNAEDALALMLWDMEEEGKEIPAPSLPATLAVKDGAQVALVHVDTLAYQRKHNSKAVKKTLTIPQWLDEAATERNVNFSRVLQEALIANLGLK